MADLGARVQGYDNMQLQIELRETHEQLSAKTIESLEFQMQLSQTQQQLSCGNMMAESMLRDMRENHEQLLARTRESHEFQLQLLQTQFQYAQTQEQLGQTQLQLVQTQLELRETHGRLLQASALTDEILAENERLQFKCQITEQEVCNLRQFKHSITAVTSGHAFGQSSWGS